MELEKIVKDLYEDSKQNTPRGLTYIANSEKLLEQAYEGRYFFELIQNVRDANKEINKDGSIFITLTENLLTISNTGAEFSEKGIESITTIGESPKHSQEFIGFKGIGFKSIQEITDSPKIVTRYGTIAFDRQLTLKEYQNAKIKAEKTPLFFFPHFQADKLSENEKSLGLVTKIELPLKEHTSEETIVENFLKIQPKQIVLLGNIKQLIFDSESTKIKFEIEENPTKNYLEVRKNDEKHKYKVFAPFEKITIPEEVVELLDGKEKEIFSNSAEVDTKIVVELNEHGQINPVEDAALYLFYPLEIRSGFRFLIHSYFIVNPERKNLRDSALNTFLLQAIGKFIANDLLKIFKTQRINAAKILSFQRNYDAKLDGLYDTVVEELKNQKFIYDTQTKKYFAADEIIVADNFDKGLFPDGKLGGKQLIYIDDEVTKEWLRDEFSVSYLTYNKILEEIEQECARQVKRKNLSFFQNLYKYINKHPLNLTNRKILLTDDWKVVSSEEDVFYIGREENRIKLPKSIKYHIKFINEGIKIGDLREGRNRLGIKEYSKYELVRRIVKLFEKNDVPNVDILNTIFNLEIDSRSKSEVQEKILFPIKGSGKWLSPITNPIYFETEELRDFYPKGNFVNESVLITHDIDKNNDKRAFLKENGVWDIPAVYLLEIEKELSLSDNRTSNIYSFSDLYEKPFYLKNDRILDIPVKFTPWFTNAIIENWNRYKSFIFSSSLPKIQYRNARSHHRIASDYHILSISGFIDFLKFRKWIVFGGSDESFSVKDIVGISRKDFRQPHNQVIKKFLKLLPFSFAEKKEFFTALGLVHLDGNSIENFLSLLNFIYNKFKNEDSLGKDFIDFYNRILGKVSDFYLSNEDRNISIETLSGVFFLGINETDNSTHWKRAKEIFYLDDKPNYDSLPLEIKQKVQPHFTKRDKNTFGRIASKIGKKSSDSITKELVKSEPLKALPLVSYFEYLPDCIAILESFLETALNDKIDLLKTIRVFEMQTITVNVSVTDSYPITIEVSHFVDNDSNYDIYLSNSFLINRNKLLAGALSELFEKILDRDLKKFGSDVYRYLSTSNKPEYLSVDDISEERIREIKDQINTFDFSPVQRFWDAVLSAKEVNNKDSIFLNKDIDVEKLAERLQISSSFIEDFQRAFSFDDTSKISNIDALSKLLIIIDLPLSKLNEFLLPRIDFRDYYNKNLIKIKNKFQNKFEAILHGHLVAKTLKQQESFLNKLDTYKHSLDLSVPIDLIAFDMDEFFLSALNEQLKLGYFTRDHLTKSIKKINFVEIFKQQFELLIKRISSSKYTQESLEKFLSGNKHRSLLYFDKTQTLAENFKGWLIENSEKNKLTEENNLEILLAEFNGTDDKEIEEVSVSNVTVPPSGQNNGGGGNGGRRYDGAANEQSKRNIGLIAEMKVFEKLKDKYKNVLWVSKNASKIINTHPGYNPDGDDSLGYDIEYFDENENKFFIEVKGKSDNYGSFEVSKNEIEKAIQEKEFYKLFFVTNTMDNSKRKINDLGNIFSLENNEDFFTNKKFTVISKNFEIRFKLNNS